MIGVIGWFLAPETLAPSAARETAPLPIGGGLSLPPTRPGARHFSGLPSTRPSFNTHSSRSGSVQRILSAVPAPALSHSADFLWGRAPPIECSSLSFIGGPDGPRVQNGLFQMVQVVQAQNLLRCPIRLGLPSHIGVSFPLAAFPAAHHDLC